MANAEVLTTIQLTGNPDWSATDMTTEDGRQVVLIQSDDQNIGILGHPEAIRVMLYRIFELLPIDLWPTNIELKESRKQA